MNKVSPTERMPDKDGEYVIWWTRDSEYKSIVHGTPDAFYLNSAKKYTAEGGQPIDIDEILFWLDEDESEQQSFLAACAHKAQTMYTRKQMEDCWKAACLKILSDLSDCFLNKENQVKLDTLTDREVIQAIGETIKNFPHPDPDRDTFIDSLKK